MTIALGCLVTACVADVQIMPSSVAQDQIHVTTCDILLGVCTAYCCAEDGEVFSWGYPQHGRLAHSLASSPALVHPLLLSVLLCFGA